MSMAAWRQPSLSLPQRPLYKTSTKSLVHASQTMDVITTNILLLILTFIFFIPCLGVLIFLLESLTRYLVSVIIFQLDRDLLWPSDFEFYGDESHGSGHYLEPWISSSSSSNHTKSLCYKSLRIGRYNPRPEERGKGVECVFCLCDVEEEEEIRELRCNHVFHRSCLDRWLDHGRSTCPLCRKSLVGEEAKPAVKACLAEEVSAVNRFDSGCLHLIGSSSI